MASIPELVVKPLHGEAYHFPLEKDVISIGRSKRNDLVLADQWLSRHHAEIRNDEGDFTIADLESRNGTYVNGEKIARIIPAPKRRRDHARRPTADVRRRRLR